MSQPCAAEESTMTPNMPVKVEILKKMEAGIRTARNVTIRILEMHLSKTESTQCF